MPKPKYKAVIFDFDDTLVESRAVKWAHHKHVAKKFYDIDLTDEVLRVHWGKPLNTLIKEIYQNSDTEENMMKVLKSTKHEYLKKLYEGSLPTIMTLLENNIKVGVVSATTKHFLVEDLKIHHFPIEHFIIIQGADETEVHKPDPRVFLPLLEKLKKEGIKSKDIVYIGDSLNDLEAAHGAGIDFIGVATGLYSVEEFKKQGAKIVIKDMSELLQNII